MSRFKLLFAGLAGLFTVAAASPALAHEHDFYRRGEPAYGYRFRDRDDYWRGRRWEAHRRWEWQRRHYPYGYYNYNYNPYYGYYR